MYKRENIHVNRILFCFWLAGISFYCACIIAKTEDLSGGVGELAVSTLAASIILFFPILKLVNRLSTIYIKDGKYVFSYRKIFTGTAVVTFLLMFFLWLGQIPGAFWGDPSVQWNQAVSGIYNDWHPAIHTLLFFSLPIKIYYHPASVVIFQLILFGLSVGYLMATMAKWQCNRKYWILAFMYITCNPLIWSIMMCPWKDSALTIILLILTGQTINLYFSDGEWLKKTIHILAMSIMMSIGCLIRHNAILYIGTLGITMLILWRKQVKNVLKVILVTMVLISFIKGPFYSYFGVQPAEERPIEVLGLPMTILGNVISKDKDSLSENTKDFLYEIASQEEWEDIYVTGNFNSIKWVKEPGDIVAKYGTKNVLKSTLEAIVKSKKYSVEAIWKLTDMVWDIGNEVDYFIYPDFPDTALDGKFEYSGIKPLKAFEEKIILLSSKNIFGMVFWNIGFWILAILLFGACLIKKNKMKWILIVCPLLVYDFGTMLLLTGNDLRFFHFNFCICLPLLFIMLNEISKGRENYKEGI